MDFGKNLTSEYHNLNQGFKFDFIEGHIKIMVDIKVVVDLGQPVGVASLTSLMSEQWNPGQWKTCTQPAQPSPRGCPVALMSSSRLLLAMLTFLGQVAHSVCGRTKCVGQREAHSFSI
uniref:Uncharacterized protein n=1 Tax=Micrurus spixii TaxID=129469 RepID=A0A2D4N6H7_9SAUR